MSIPTTQVQFRRGTAAENAAFLGGTGELVVDLTNGRIIVHDSILQGGYTGAKLTDLNTAINNLSGYFNIISSNNPGITALSGNLYITGSNLYKYITGLSGASNATYATISNLYNTGSFLYNYISGFTITAAATYATIPNLYNTGHNLYTIVTGLSGSLHVNNIVYQYGDQIISGLKSFNSPIYDIFGTESLNLNNRTFYDSFDQISANWDNRTLTNYTNGISLSWTLGELYDFNVNLSASWFQRFLYNPGFIPTLDWGNRLLTGGNWNAQSLYVSGSPVVTYSQIPDLSNFNNIVYKTGSQTISGNKLFSGQLSSSGLIIYDSLVGGAATSALSGSIAYGFHARARKEQSFAIGSNADANGKWSTAIGFGASTAGDSSFSLGEDAISAGYGSYAIGAGAESIGLYSFAIGRGGAFSNRPHSFIISLDDAVAVSDTQDNQFRSNFTGGYYFDGSDSHINNGSMYISGSPVITAAQTGGFGGGGGGGIYNQSGSYIFNNDAISGATEQFISFPSNLGPNPIVICSLNNISGDDNIFAQTSGITSLGYYARYSNIINSSGYKLTTIASLSSQTGLATTVIIQNNITTGNTGNFYTLDNPSGFVTSGMLSGNLFPPSQNYNTNINWAISNTFYTILTGNTNFTFSNQRDGQNITVSVSNTGITFYSGTWPSNVKWPGQIPPIQTSGSFTDIYTFINITGAIYGSAVQGF